MNGDRYAPRAEIRVAGTLLAADATQHVLSVTYDNNLDLADMFTITFRNPDGGLTDSALFDLGKQVEIHMGYGDELRPMMLGKITALQPSFPQNGPPTLTVSGYDRSYELRHNQPDRQPFKFMTDSAIAAQIAAEAGLVPVVDPSPYYHDHIQQTESDIAFLKQRARANFFDVYVHWNSLYFQFPRPQAPVALEWGRNLSSFTPRLANAGQPAIQVVRGYNEQIAEAVVGVATTAVLGLDDLLERLGSESIDALVTIGRRTLRKESVKTPVDAAAVAKAVLQELLDGLYEGSGTCIGMPELRAGSFAFITGVGTRFNGPYRLSRVTQTIDDGGFHTSFEVTQRLGASLLQTIRKQVTGTPPDAREKFEGVVVGKVTDNFDPDGLARVKVSFPWFSENSESGWARCVSPSAGGDRGLYFLPDVGDEVAVAFEHGELDRPFVLGSMWNGLARPPLTNADRKNKQRQIKTKGKSTITIDDTPSSESVEVKTPKGQTVKLSDTGSGSVQVKAGGCEVVLDATSGLVTVKGSTGVTIQNGTLGAARRTDAVAPSVELKTWMIEVAGSIEALTMKKMMAVVPAVSIGQISGGSGTVKIG